MLGELEWREIEKVNDPPPEPEEYDVTSGGKISPLVFNLKNLTERVLIAACMSPVPASPAFSLKKDGESINFI